jgi:hypothetical protein
VAVPSIANPIWNQLICGQKQIEFNCLAIKIFLGRARVELSRDPTAARQLVNELHELVVANETLPSMQKDLVKLAA